MERIHQEVAMMAAEDEVYYELHEQAMAKMSLTFIIASLKANMVEFEFVW